MIVDADAVEKLFTTNGKDAWRCVSYCAEPTARFQNLETKEICGGSVYSKNVAQFKPLTVPGGE